MRSSDQPAIRATSSVPFDETNAIGRYVSGLDLERPVSSTLSGYFIFQLEAGGTGWNATLEAPNDPEPMDVTAISWQIDEYDRVFIWRDTGLGYYSGRTWEKVAEDSATGNVYVIENPDFGTLDPDFDIPFEPGRLSFYRKVELE